MAKGLVPIGDLTGTVVIDLNKGNYFKGTLKGNIELEIVNGDAGDLFFIDLRQDNVGGYSVTFGAGVDDEDPSGYLKQMFTNTSPGKRSIGMWTTDGGDAIAMGFNAHP